MSNLSHLWDRPIIKCEYKRIACGLAFLADNAPGDTTPPLFVCAAGFNLVKGSGHYHEDCKKKCMTVRLTKMPAKKKRTARHPRKIGPKRQSSSRRERPLWIRRGFCPDEVYK